MNVSYLSKNKDPEPFEYFWLNEYSFQLLVEKIKNESIKEFKISTIGNIVDNNVNEGLGFATLKYDNSILKLDLSRISKNYKISKLPYYIYGHLVKKSNEIILVVSFYRLLSEAFDFENYKQIISNIRVIKQECENLS